MSVTSLPEWKQLLLERKRREEEERDRREKEEEEKLANMPAWKRGIIQRRKAKQEVPGDKDRETERDGYLLMVDGKSLSDCQSDTDSSVAVHLGSEPSLSPEPGHWLDGDIKPQSRVSSETIVPVHRNPFIRTQSGWRRGREVNHAREVAGHEKGQESDIEPGRDKDTDKLDLRGHDGETGRGLDTESKMERHRDRSEGKERDRSVGREKESLKARKEEEEHNSDLASPAFPPLVSSLRTIRADNIIIIEQERKGSDDWRARRRETEKDRLDEDAQEKRGVKMDLREILAGGGSVTEIRASEVLIIKPAGGLEERSGGGGGSKRRSRGSSVEDEREKELKVTRDVVKDAMGREQRSDGSWLRDKERVALKEKERPWGQATVIKEVRKDSSDDVFVDKGGRVSQLLSRFGEHNKPPSRSKSTDSFVRPYSDQDSEDNDVDASHEGLADGQCLGFRGVPKRSFSFSDRRARAQENGMVEEARPDRRAVERAHSDRRVEPRREATERKGSEKGSVLQLKEGRGWLLDPGRIVKHRDGSTKTDQVAEEHVKRDHTVESNVKYRSDNRASTHNRVETVSAAGREHVLDKRAMEMAHDVEGDTGFTVVPVKNTEGISFARRVPIRQDGKVKAAETEARQLKEEKERALEMGRSAERGLASRKQNEHLGVEMTVSETRRGEGEEELLQQNHSINLSLEPPISPRAVNDSRYKHTSAFTECSSLLSTVASRPGDPHRGTDWSSKGQQGHYETQSVLSQQTEDLISKIEKVGETTIYNSDRGERAYRSSCEGYRESTSAHDPHIYSDVRSEYRSQDITPRSQRRAVSVGPSPTSLEIQIPTTVFYGAEEMLERKRGNLQSDEGQDRDGGKGVERRDSWRVGKPLSRIESLREKIRQRERERMRKLEQGGMDGDVDGVDRTEDVVPQRAEDRYEERVADMGTEWDASDYTRKGMTETERVQEGLMTQTSSAAFDVTQEVLKTSPQLPVSLPFCRGNRREEETNRFTAGASEDISTGCQVSEDEDDVLQYVEEQLRSDKAWRREPHSPEEDREEEEEEEEVEEEFSEEERYNLSLSPLDSLSPSPPHPNSLAAMSRIYNLKTVGSRAGLCVSERPVEVPSVHLAKVQPRISQEPCNLDTADVRKLWNMRGYGDNKPCSEDMSGVQTVQRQIEQIQLREQEVRKLSQDDGGVPQSTPRDRETKGQLSPRGARPQASEGNVKVPEQVQLKSVSSPRLGAQRVCSPTPQGNHDQPRTVTMAPRFIQSQPPDSLINSLKSAGCPPNRPGSPCSPSPTQSPITSPSPSSSPVLFSIRSASGGQVKRGATITVTPRKPAGAAAAVATPAAPGNTKTPGKEGQNMSVVDGAEPAKKRYPTAEEIEVIGGYQNLEKSCLIKNRGSSRRVKVCFDEEQLEQVCEYPSETAMLACTPYPHDVEKEDRGREEETHKQEEDEEEEERGVVISKSTMSVGTATGRMLRVVESCPR